MGIANDWRIGYYLSFATQFTLIFGLCFELPVIVWVLVKIGLLNYELMSRTRGYAVVAIIIIAAIITPTPDAFTLCLLAMPMIILYEISIWLAWFDARKIKKAEAKEEAERMERMLANPPVESTEDLEPEIDSDPPPLDSTEEGEEMDVGDDPTKEQKSE
jgi:sec-independent protein translocase protein TatC